MTLDGGWKVDASITRPANATGGHFSASYVVENSDGRQAFLKAIDYVAALQSPDPPQALQTLTEQFNFEREIVQSCAAKRMSRIIRSFDHGSVNVTGFPIPRVSYLIFELADGDIRKYRSLSDSVDLSWALGSLHGVALGLRQLHAAGIAHQDLKPSNVMTFGENVSKIGDFGRAAQLNGVSPFDSYTIAGDLAYAPPELFYGHLLPSWDRRRAADLYHLGSLLLFQLTDVSATQALFAEIDEHYLPVAYGGAFGGSYDQIVPYLRDAIDRISSEMPVLSDPVIEAELAQHFRDLCEPDPLLRGHPKARCTAQGNRWDLQRYVSRFDALAKRVAVRGISIDLR